MYYSILYIVYLLHVSFFLSIDIFVEKKNGFDLPFKICKYVKCSNIILLDFKRRLIELEFKKLNGL
jgi:hypothetical protein